MAVLSGVPGLEVRVGAEGSPLPETDPAVSETIALSEEPNESSKDENAASSLDATNITTKYIEAKTDESFSFLIILRPPFLKFVKRKVPDFFALSVLIIIDGVPVSEPLYRASRLERLAVGKAVAFEARGYTVGKSRRSGHVKDFFFRKIVTTASDSDDVSPERIKQDETALAPVGTIILEIYVHKKEDIDSKDETVPRRDLMSPNLAFDLSQPVHAASLKNNISHGVALGPPQFYRHLGKASHLIKEDSDPLGVFVFKYRSLKFLEQQQGLSTTLSSPEPQNEPMKMVEKAAAMDLSSPTEQPKKLKIRININKNKADTKPETPLSPRGSVGVLRFGPWDEGDGAGGSGSGSGSGMGVFEKIDALEEQFRVLGEDEDEDEDENEDVYVDEDVEMVMECV